MMWGGGVQAPWIITSLVRSNSAGRIGFLSEPERLNVLLSRARNGHIFIGSKDTLTGTTASKMCALLPFS